MRFLNSILFSTLIVNSALFSATSNANSSIDLTVPASQEPLTDVGVFDESVIFSPNFAINQNDPALSDLFDSNGASELCYPTALAESLIYLFGYHTPKLNNLKLEGISPDLNTISPNDLIRQLVTACKTDVESGTDTDNATSCVVSILGQSGYSMGDTKMITPFTSANPNLPIEVRDVKIEDIRRGLKSGNPVILEVSWFEYNSATKHWTRRGGHYVGAYGYDYNLSWGENEIQVKVINPNLAYDNSRGTAVFDTVTIQGYSVQPGVIYPNDRPFILSGNGFNGATKRAFLGEALVVAPK